MEGLGWLLAIIVGALAGWIAEKIMKTDQSLLMNIVFGILGALIFNWVLYLIFGSTLGGILGQLFVGVVGACALIAALHAVKSRS